MSKRLTITGINKIQRMAYYADATWSAFVNSTTKPGALYYISNVKETDACYELRVNIIQPQPDGFFIKIWRNSIGDLNTGKDRDVWFIDYDDSTMYENRPAEELSMQAILDGVTYFMNSTHFAPSTPF